MAALHRRLARYKEDELGPFKREVGDISDRSVAKETKVFPEERMHNVAKNM